MGVNHILWSDRQSSSNQVILFFFDWGLVHKLCTYSFLYKVQPQAVIHYKFQPQAVTTVVVDILWLDSGFVYHFAYCLYR